MTKKELLATCKDLGIDTSGLDTNAKLKAAIEAKQAETANIEVTESVVAEDEKTPAKEGKTEAAWKDEAGVSWVFKKNAPKSLNIDGHSLSREEILNNEEIISELVYGKCPHLTRKQ